MGGKNAVKKKRERKESLLHRSLGHERLHDFRKRGKGGGKTADSWSKIGGGGSVHLRRLKESTAPDEERGNFAEAVVVSEGQNLLLEKKVGQRLSEETETYAPSITWPPRRRGGKTKGNSKADAGFTLDEKNKCLRVCESRTDISERKTPGESWKS